jgi:hypothetical protein
MAVPEGEETMELNATDIQVLLESLKYSIQRVSDTPGTPYSVRQENLARLRDAQQKLRLIAREMPA